MLVSVIITIIITIIAIPDAIVHRDVAVLALSGRMCIGEPAW